MIAQKLANEAMAKHGLIEKGWIFQFDRATSRLGATHFSNRRITVSKHFTNAATEEQFMQTMLHEIAHALLPAYVKHGPEWKRLARKIGYSGKRTSENPYRHPSRRVYQVLEVANNEDKPAIRKGSKLAFPNGTALEVTKAEEQSVTAVDKSSGAVWTLLPEGAHHFLTH